jgi:5-amino-6-(5-phosphoribosylamino)uracil reductase
MGRQTTALRSGGELNQALIRAGLIDELHLTICSRILGGRNAPTIAEGTGGLSLSDAALLKLKTSRRAGDELFLVYEATRGRPR